MVSTDTNENAHSNVMARRFMVNLAEVMMTSTGSLNVCDSNISARIAIEPASRMTCGEIEIPECHHSNNHQLPFHRQ